MLNGGYNVHPVPPPKSEIKERIRKRYERERIKIEKLFTLGYTTSRKLKIKDINVRWNVQEIRMLKIKISLNLKKRLWKDMKEKELK